VLMDVYWISVKVTVFGLSNREVGWLEEMNV